MIAPSQRKEQAVVLPEAGEAEAPKSGLPRIERLAAAALWINAPLVALYLAFGRLAMGLSLIGGMLISLTVCTILHLMVGQGLQALAREISGPSDSVGKNTAFAKFAGLVIAKFAAVILVAFLIMSVPGVRIFGVALGFAVTQAAVVVTVAKMNKGSIVNKAG